MKILLGFILITIVMCVFMSCDKTVKYDDNLLFAMKLLEENPDIIMIMGSYWPKKPTSMRLGFEATEDSSQALLKAFTTERQGWSELKAVENKQVYSAHHGLPREVFDAAVFEYLAKTFYPEEFADVDPEATLKEFYDKFLPYSYSGIWFMHMN